MLVYSGHNGSENLHSHLARVIPKYDLFQSGKRPVAKLITQKHRRFIPRPRGSNGQVEQTTNRLRMKNPLSEIVNKGNPIDSDFQQRQFGKHLPCFLHAACRLDKNDSVVNDGFLFRRITGDL